MDEKWRRFLSARDLLVRSISSRCTYHAANQHVFATRHYMGIRSLRRRETPLTADADECNIPIIRVSTTSGPLTVILGPILPTFAV